MSRRCRFTGCRLGCRRLLLLLLSLELQRRLAHRLEPLELWRELRVACKQLATQGSYALKNAEQVGVHGLQRRDVLGKATG